MKASLSLPERPTALYLVAILDVLALLLVFFLLVAGTGQESGFLARLPESEFRLPRQDRSVSVTVLGGGQPSVFIGRQRVALKDFAVRLEEVSEESGAENVLLRVDEGVSVKVDREIIETALGLGLKVYLVGREAGGAVEDEESVPVPPQESNP